MTPVERLDEIEERHGDWYGQTRAGVWTDLDGELRDMRSDTVEQQVQARQIVRNDVPDLVAALRAVLDLADGHLADLWITHSPGVHEDVAGTLRATITAALDGTR